VALEYVGLRENGLQLGGRYLKNGLEAIVSTSFEVSETRKELETNKTGEIRVDASQDQRPVNHKGNDRNGKVGVAVGTNSPQKPSSPSHLAPKSPPDTLENVQVR
jgi:hypothetical protein